jgi:tripartite-type tricarboxylate transporter receptor subunit TctC
MAAIVGSIWSRRALNMRRGKNMASGGVGSGNHIAGELFSMMTGVKLAHVPYRARRRRWSI